MFVLIYMPSAPDERMRFVYRSDTQANNNII